MHGKATTHHLSKYPIQTITPQWPELKKLREKEAKITTEQTKEYNRRHAVKELSNLSPGDRVYIPDRKENAVVVVASGTSEYVVACPGDI